MYRSSSSICVLYETTRLLYFPLATPVCRISLCDEFNLEFRMDGLFAVIDYIYRTKTVCYVVDVRYFALVKDKVYLSS